MGRTSPSATPTPAKKKSGGFWAFLRSFFTPRSNKDWLNTNDAGTVPNTPSDDFMQANNVDSKFRG